MAPPPESTPVRRSALVSQVIGVLQSAISSGRWPTGSRLPTESELAEEYGVSRVTLRQAVQALVHVGLLETIQGSGTFVRATTEVDAVLSRFLAGENLLSVLEVREAIETVAAALAARRRSSDDLAAIDTAVAEQATAASAGDDTAVAAASARFHTAIVKAAGNPILVHFYAAVQTGAARTFADAPSPQTPSEFLDEHRAIAEAIRDQDSDLARLLSQRHLQPVITATAQADPG
jgi:DNA-binding FadR family transcriptional regulator